MTEWWTYALSDFLLFSPRTYYRLFELHNRDVWPTQIATLAAGFGVLFLVVRNAAWRGRIVSTLLAMCWLWVAWAFHFQRYAGINWAATWFAAGFAVEALLLLWIGSVRGKLEPIVAGIGSRRRIAGIGLLLFALVVQPLIAPVSGRSWMQMEMFGIAPDPTVVATLGVLLPMRGPRWLLFPVPLAWCAISGATLWTMGAVDALLMPFIAVLSVLLAMQRIRLPAALQSLGR